MCINFFGKIIICSNEGIFLLEDLLSKILYQKELKITNKPYNAGMQIQNNIFALHQIKLI